MRLIFLSFTLVLCFLLSAPTRVSAEYAKEQKVYVTIPIIYVTDRAAKKQGYGPQRKFETVESINDLHCGWLDYSLKADQPVSSQQKQLGWTESQKQPDKIMVTRELSDVKNYRDFGPVLIDAAKKAGTKDVFVMVHGFNTPFANAAKEAALLAQRVQCPLILYSWPSKGRIGQYNVDLGNNEWSQEHFDALLEELKSVKDSAGIKYTLLAHSMGNRLVVRSAPVLQGKHLFKDMFLVDPDFDAETFVHYLVRYGRKTDQAAKIPDQAATIPERVVQVTDQAEKLPDQTEKVVEKSEPSEPVNPVNPVEPVEPVEPTKVRILFSHKDHALPLSAFLFGGYTRLGQAADSLLATVVAPYTIPGKITDVFGAGDAKDVTARINNQASSWLMNFQWIDFTVLDHGVIGHTIPYQLVSSLWSTNLPGDGLKLVHSENGSPNKLSKLFIHIFGESDHISSKIDSSEKVVLTTKTETASKHH